MVKSRTGSGIIRLVGTNWISTSDDIGTHRRYHVVWSFGGKHSHRSGRFCDTMRLGCGWLRSMFRPYVDGRDGRDAFAIPSVCVTCARSSPCIRFRRFVWDASATPCVAACVGALGHTRSGRFGDTIRGIVEKGVVLELVGVVLLLRCGAARDTMAIPSDPPVIWECEVWALGRLFIQPRDPCQVCSWLRRHETITSPSLSVCTVAVALVCEWRQNHHHA